MRALLPRTAHPHIHHLFPNQSDGNFKLQAPYTLSVKLNDFTVWRHSWQQNWVNCAVLTGNSADLRNILSSRLSHRELRNSLRGSHSFLSLPADSTMASSQGTSVSSKSFSRWTSHDILLFHSNNGCTNAPECHVKGVTYSLLNWAILLVTSYLTEKLSKLRCFDRQ
jgi:hypothetical protein